MTESALWDTLFQLIRYEISGTATAVPVESDGLSELYAVARRQDLIHLVVAALQENGHPIDDERLQQRYAAVWRGEQMTHELERLARVLGAAEMMYVPLKGAVIRDLYPEVWMRTSADVDVLVHKSDVERVAVLLQRELGYRVGKRSHHDVQLIARSGVNVELHFSLCERMPKMDAVLDTVWDYVSPHPDGGYRMTSEFQIFHVLAHLAYHFSNMGSGIRPFLDLWLLRRQKDYDEEKVLALCEESGLTTFYDVCCRLGERWFDGKPTEDEGLDEVQAYCLSDGIYGSKQNGVATTRRQSGSKWSYLKRKLFMPRDQLEILYPALKEHPSRLGWYQLCRWSKLLRSDTRARAREAIRLNQATEDETVEQTDRLMSRLGL